MISLDNAWLETVVCSARKGREARLKRLIAARVELQRRCEGCLAAWSAPAIGQEGMFLIQAAFDSEESWREASERRAKELDSVDGGIESELSGPPLVGMFWISRSDIPVGD